MEDKTGQAPNRSPPIDTRERGEERDDGEAGSKPIREGDGMGKRENHTPAIDASHRHRRYHEASSPLTPPTRYHIARTRGASRHRTQHDIAPLDDTRNGAGGEARRYDTRDGEKGETASGETMPHARQRAGHVSTMGADRGGTEYDDGTTSPTRQASRNERDTRRTAEAPRKRERENQRNPIELTPSTPSASRAVLSSSPHR